MLKICDSRVAQYSNYRSWHHVDESTASEICANDCLVITEHSNHDGKATNVYDMTITEGTVRNANGTCVISVVVTYALNSS